MDASYVLRTYVGTYILNTVVLRPSSEKIMRCRTAKNPQFVLDSPVVQDDVNFLCVSDPLWVRAYNKSVNIICKK